MLLTAAGQLTLMASSVVAPPVWHPIGIPLSGEEPTVHPLNASEADVQFYLRPDGTTTVNFRRIKSTSNLL